MKGPLLKISIRVQDAYERWFAERQKSEPDEKALAEAFSEVRALTHELNELEANAHYAKHGLRYLTALSTPEANSEEINLGVQNIMNEACHPRLNKNKFTEEACAAWDRANKAWLHADGYPST